MTLVMERVTSAADPAFAALIAIYEEALPDGERKPAFMIEAMAGRDDYRILAWREGGEVAAFAMILAPVDEGFGLLEYMGVKAGLRGEGRGSVVYAQGLASVRADRPRSLIIEVDSEREASDDREVRLARKRFYRRMGALQVEGLAYVLPFPKAWKMPAMDVMVDTDPAGRAVTKGELREWLRAMWAGAYRRPGEEARIDAMLAPVGDPVGWV
jgi:hypothetical protein